MQMCQLRIILLMVGFVPKILIIVDKVSQKAYIDLICS